MNLQTLTFSSIQPRSDSSHHSVLILYTYVHLPGNSKLLGNCPMFGAQNFAICCSPRFFLLGFQKDNKPKEEFRTFVIRRATVIYTHMLTKGLLIHVNQTIHALCTQFTKSWFDRPKRNMLQIQLYFCIIKNIQMAIVELRELCPLC